MAEPIPKALRSWLEQELAISGVMAAGGGNLGGTVFSAVADGEFVLAHNEEIWRCLAGALDSLRVHGSATREMLWGFEHAVLCTVRRDDGLWLGVFSTPHLDDEAALALRAKLDTFKTHDFGGAA
jgi:hypothetical protein